MNTSNNLNRLLVALGVLFVFTVGVFFALGVRSLVAGTASASPQVPNPGHGYSQIELPAGTWTGLDADLVDGMDASEIGGVPSGTIVMWSGSIASIPSGWALCDGTNGTPDLRNTFVIGAGSSYAVGDTGGASTHSHGAGSYAVGSHTHNVPARTGNWGDTHTCYPNNPLAVTSIDTARTVGHDLPTGSSNASFSGTSGSATSLPPYYALAYIMKL